jgi:hypothetical protein
VIWVDSTRNNPFPVSAEPTDAGAFVLIDGEAHGLRPAAFPRLPCDEGPRYDRHVCGGSA